MAHSSQWSHQLPKGLFLLGLHMGGSGTIHNPSYCIQYSNITTFYENWDESILMMSGGASQFWDLIAIASVTMRGPKLQTLKSLNLLIEKATLHDSMSVSGGRLRRCLRCGRFNGYNKSSTLSCQARCPMNMLPGTDYMTLLLSSSLVCYGHYTI